MYATFMSENRIQNKLRELEHEADKIEIEINKLILNADVENNPRRRVQISFGGD